MNNQFVFGEVVSGQHYCQRSSQEKRFIDYIRSGQNVFIQGERRLGKTSFILHSAKKVFKSKIIVVDCYGVKNSVEFIERLLSNGVTQKNLSRWVSDLSGIKFEINSGIFKATLGADSKASDYIEVLERLNHEKDTLLFFDEFQDLLKIEDGSEQLLALLRSKLQHFRNPVVFSGSERNAMDGIFLDYDSPFYQGAIPFLLEPIPAAIFQKFLAQKFARGGYEIEATFWERLKAITAYNPGYTQHLCFIVWDMKDGKAVLNAACVDDAMRRIFRYEKSHYEYLLSTLTALQKRVTIGLATLNVAPSSEAFLRYCRTHSASSVFKSLKLISDKRIIWRDVDGHYRFSSPFFREWLTYL